MTEEVTAVDAKSTIHDAVAKAHQVLMDLADVYEAVPPGEESKLPIQADAILHVQEVLAKLLTTGSYRRDYSAPDYDGDTEIDVSGETGETRTGSIVIVTSEVSDGIPYAFTKLKQDDGTYLPLAIREADWKDEFLRAPVKTVLDDYVSDDTHARFAKSIEVI